MKPILPAFNLFDFARYKLKKSSYGLRFFFLLVPFLLFSDISSAQVYTYEDMPREVKERMDLNKQNSLPSWDGIVFSYFVSVEGLEPGEHKELLDRAANIPEIFSVNFQNNDLVIVECKGGTNFDFVKRIFSSLVSNISGIKNIGSVKSTEQK